MGLIILIVVVLLLVGLSRQAVVDSATGRTA